jgi:dihydrofolate reductase
VRYSVAASLDGYIAGPNGEYDWIVMDPAIDFRTLLGQFDTVLMGRKTYRAAQGQGGAGAMPGMRAFVFSRTLHASDCRGATLVADGFEEVVRGLKRDGGKDIWLVGGGGLFRSLLGARLVDTVEVALIPVVLGGGMPLIEPGERAAALRLTKCEPLAATGTVMLSYDVAYDA